jgi:hypothetical protein
MKFNCAREVFRSLWKFDLLCHYKNIGPDKTKNPACTGLFYNIAR